MGHWPYQKIIESSMKKSSLTFKLTVLADVPAKSPLGPLITTQNYGVDKEVKTSIGALGSVFLGYRGLNSATTLPLLSHT